MQATTARIKLRPVKRGDIPQIEEWYAEAAAAVRGGVSDDEVLAARLEAAGERLLAIVSRDADEPIGLLEYRLHEPADGWLRVTFIAVREGRRGFGYGSEAMRALEEWTERTHETTSFLAEIDTRNGLALYFCLRVGYRPAHAGEVFWRAPDEGGIIAMIRENTAE